MSRYAIAKIPAPILNTPHFMDVFGKETLPLDEIGLLRSLEMIAFPGTKFEILRQINDWIVAVKTVDYLNVPFFIDLRFLSPCSKSTPERQKILPSRDKIIFNLQKCLGSSYIWGGNWKEGIPEILTFYRTIPIDSKMQPQWTLQGLDCSGLLYEATQGCTPRNTSELIDFGHSLFIENQDIKTIQAQVLPLDLIAWKGHVIIVFDDKHVIESVHNRGGVVLTNLEERLNQIMFQEKRIPRNVWSQQNTHSFVIRRFINCYSY